MELDELKSAWTQYDKKLTENLKLNEELIRKMNLNHSKKEMQKPLFSELLNLTTMFICVVYFTASSIRFINEPKFCIPGFIIVALCLVIVVFSVIKTNRILNIDYYGTSLIELQKDISNLKKLILILRKYEFYSILIFLIVIFPISFKSILNIDIYQNIKLYAIEVIMASCISFPLTIWINKYLYDKKIENVEKLLDDLNRFEKEE